MKKQSILIIESNYYSEISKDLLKGSLDVIRTEKINYKILTVPGSLEIPVVLEKYKKDFDGFVILGCVIRGETTHYDVVQNINSNSIYKIVNKDKLALGYGLLTVENLDQAKERADPSRKNIGGKVTEVCLKMINILKE